jgi:glycine/D-amino acid oxidase-like deaminating enzyme
MPEQRPAIEADFTVVGAGLAGCAAAARLSEARAAGKTNAAPIMIGRRAAGLARQEERLAA